MDTDLFRDAFPFWENLTEAQRAEMENNTTRRKRPGYISEAENVRAFRLSEAGERVYLLHLREAEISLFSGCLTGM